MRFYSVVRWCAPLVAALAITFTHSSLAAAAAPWANAALLSDSGDLSDPAQPKIVADPAGGFHALYLGNAKKSVRYKRFDGTTLSAATTLKTGSTVNFNPSIALSTNGDVQVAWENWASGGPEVAWAKSTNQGASFTPQTTISTSNQTAKWPLISGVGTTANDDAVVTYYSSSSAPGAGNNRLHSITYSGTSWSADTQMAQSSTREAQVDGIARNPVDGKVYRLLASNNSTLEYAIYNPATDSWGATQTAVTGIAFFARAKIAINDAGTIAIAYDFGDKSYVTMKKTTDASFSAPQMTFNNKWWGDILSIPGTNDFYMVDSNGNNEGVYGRRYTNGAWTTTNEVIDATAADNVWMSGSSVNGKIYLAWQYGDTGNVLTYYSQMQYYTPVPEPGSLALATLGFGGCMLWVRRRRKSAFRRPKA